MYHVTKTEVLLVLCIIIALLVKVKFHITKLSKTQMVLILIAIIACLYKLVTSSHVKTNYENYRNSVEAFQQKAGEANVETDDVNPVLKDTTVFMSCFDKASYANPAETWVNVSPNAQDANRAFAFKTVPDSSTNGFPMKDLVINGPKSTDLGIDGTRSYSMFWYARTNSVPGTALSNRAVRVISIYGNSDNNNIGMEIMLRWRNSDKSSLQMIVQHSDDDPFNPPTPPTGLSVYENKNMTDPHFLLDGNFHLYTLVRSNTELRLYVDNVSEPLIKANITPSKVLFSNKRMVINQQGTWDANLMFFGIYRRELSGNDITNLYNYLYNMVVTNSDSWRSQRKELKAIKKSLQNATTCPFPNDNLCKNDCKFIDDWSDSTKVVDPANKHCVQKIVKYCNAQENKNKPYCALWKQETHELMYGNKVCRNMPKKQNDAASKPKESVSDAIQRLKGENPVGQATAKLRDTINNDVIKDKEIKDNIAKVLNTLDAQPPRKGFAKLRTVGDGYMASDAELGANIGSVSASDLRVINANPLAVDKNMNRDRYDEILKLYQTEVINKSVAKPDSKKGGFMSIIKNMFS